MRKALLAVLLLVPGPLPAQSDDARILEAVSHFRRRAFDDTTRIQSAPEWRGPPPCTRFIIADSIRLRADTARVHLTLREGEHIHRELLRLIGRDGVWDVVRVEVGGILRLHGGCVHGRPDSLPARGRSWRIAK